ncbi:transmembrane protein [Legionella steelei]|uniref:Transmembrane protein n=2 Tax=Legionella steelei TaxID=947033 RepID=A0A0W0ZKI6_9GAMM|nr:transmembrane protein [Legionella steelei]
MHPKSQPVSGFIEIFFVRTEYDIIINRPVDCVFLIQDETIIDIKLNYPYNPRHPNLRSFLCVRMSKKGEEGSSLKSQELVSLLAIAGCIDAQSRLLAQKLDNDRYIYHAYAVVDSLSSSYSMFKYFMEVFMRNTDADYLHKIATSPEGIAAISAEAIFLVSFSFLASVFDGEENDSVKKFIAAAWPYFRDVMKGLKNAYKGWRSTVQVLGALGLDLKDMLIPVGLVLGVFAAANRFWIRSMQERRKKQMNANKELLVEIRQLTSLTKLDRKAYLSRIEQQSDEDRIHAFLAVTTGGLLDGLYLYMGVMSLAILAPHLFLAMTVLSVFYTLACVVTRIYEEYDFQLRLEVTQTRCKLELTSKELELTYAKLLELQETAKKKFINPADVKQLKLRVCQLIQQFDEERQLLQEQTTHSYLTAGLLGMKYGLFGYGVLTSILFTVSSVFLVTASAFPPALLAAFIVSGLVLMIGMTAFMLHSHHQYVQKQKAENEKECPYDQIKKMKANIEAQNDAEYLTAESFKSSLKNGSNPSSSPQSFFQEWFEVFRCFASGLSKGNNFSNFATSALQEEDPEGHYHDVPIMGILAIANAVLFSLILGLRALARGLGRPPLGQVSPSKDKEPGPNVSVDKDKIKTESPRESSEPAKRRAPDSLPRSGSSFSLYNFFFHKDTASNSPSGKMTHSKSDNALTHHVATTGGSTIRGLD